MADPVPNPAALVAENDDFEDTDSAFGGSNAASSTTSIGSSILKFREENGRTYHAYKEGVYVLPNDERENDRLDLQHHLFDLTFGGKLCILHDKLKNIHRVLDAGTGTGIWAIDFADEHPEAKVIGVDLSPIQPTFTPPNLTFFVDDVEETWAYSEKFDFIYARMMTGSLADWPKFIQQCFDNLNPGGYVECADIIFPIFCDDGTLPEDSAMKKWGDLMLEASEKLGRSVTSGTKVKGLLETAGFTDVVETVYKWPMNRWPKDAKYKEIGMWTYENIATGIQGLSMALFTRGLGWSAEELEVFLTDVRKDMKSTRIHAYWKIYVISGQKPGSNKTEIVEE